jgi:hypothetical protein
MNEKAYYACTNPVAVLDDMSGLNVFELNCEAHETWATTWPACYVEPTCASIPEPDAASGLRRVTPGDFVKLGEPVVYECVNKSNYQEMENVSKTN